MSLSTDYKNTETTASDLIAERQRNKERVTPVRNIHKTQQICHLYPNEIGTVSPLQALRHRAWLRPITCDEPVTDAELLGKTKPKAKKKTAPTEGAE